MLNNKKGKAPNIPYRTTYGVFIIEFLRSSDYPDGEYLHDILELSRIKSTYVWVDSKEGLEDAVEQFTKSKFRYLHISCHADREGFEINGEDITNTEFQKMTHKHINNKRVFLSACKGSNRFLASELIAKNNVMSVIGFPNDIAFDKAALFWPTFYHVLEEIDRNKMKRNNIIDVIKKLVELLNIPVNYYSRINGSVKYIRRLKLQQGQTDNRKLLIKYNK